MVVFLITGVTALGFRPYGYTIKGDITANNGTVFYLQYQYNGKQVKDSAAVSANQFVFKGSLPEPVICTLSNSFNKQIKIFIAENADIILRGNLDQVFNVTVENSSEETIYNEFKQKYGELSGRYRVMVKASGSDLHDKTSEPYKVFHQRLDSLTAAFVQKNSNTSAASLAITDCYVTNPDRKNAKRYYALLSDKGKQSAYAKRILQFVNAADNIAPGHIAPDFVLNDDYGQSRKLSDYKGKYVLLDFWASWCAPCRKEHPNLKTCYKRYGNSLQFIGISMDTNEIYWKQAVIIDQLPWIQLNDPKSMNGIVADAYGVKAIPFNCIVNPEGVIVAVNLRGNDLTRYLSAHFKTNK